MNYAPETAHQLIPLTENNDGATAVLGRDLHTFLEVKTAYKDWFPRMVEYGFVAGQDYALKNERVPDSLGRSRERTNHVMTLDMAKEISMIQRTERGKQARQYFIEVERRYKAQTPALPTTYVEALESLLAAEKEKLALTEANERQARELETAAPKVEAYDTFIDATGTYSIGAVGKMLDIGQNKLFQELRNRGVLIAKGAMRNTPYQRYMHHFEVKAHTFTRNNGEERTTYTTYVQPSGIEFIARQLNMPVPQMI